MVSHYAPRLTLSRHIYIVILSIVGSGKSTLFRLLMACETNERPIDLHESIELTTPVHSWGDLSNKLTIPEASCKAPDEDCKVEEKENVTHEIPVTSITMPSSDVVEISQVFYWPLYTTPIDWIYQQHITTHSNVNKNQARAVATELQSLSFSQSQNNPDSPDNTRNADALELLTNTLQETKEDWFSELSGGQKSKVELVRKVFLREKCPSVLLIGEIGVVLNLWCICQFHFLPILSIQMKQWLHLIQQVRAK